MILGNAGSARESHFTEEEKETNSDPIQGQIHPESKYFDFSRISGIALGVNLSQFLCTTNSSQEAEK